MGQLPLSEMRAQVLALCKQDIDDEQFARELVASEVFEVLLSVGACDSNRAAEILGYKSKRSVESMAQKSPRFPQPFTRKNLWSVQNLYEYATKHRRTGS